VRALTDERSEPPAPTLGELGGLAVADALAALGSAPGGLSTTEARERRRVDGPNALRVHDVRAWRVFARQLNNPILLLLFAAAAMSLAVGERADALIVLLIVTLSVTLGFVNEYRSARAVAALRAQVRHTAMARRDGRAGPVDVTELVRGDVVELDVGDVVPADVRLLEVTGLECDEALLTGESLPAVKSAAPAEPGDSPLALTSCAFMGTIVRGGTARAVVARTGQSTAFGGIATSLGAHVDETAFQHGLRDFSKLLINVTAALTVSIFVINTALQRPLLESALFALAIAVGLAPQLLPAIVTISLARGAALLAHGGVVVKRLIAIEDLGNIETLFTDKTGTLTQGSVRFTAALDPHGEPAPSVLGLGLVCNAAVVEDGRAVGGNQLDRALWDAGALAPRHTRVADAPFDYDRQRMSVLADLDEGGRLLVVKGAPEAILARCRSVEEATRATLEAQFAAGARIVALATRAAPELTAIVPADEHDLELAGFLAFADPPKTDAAAAIARLARLDVAVKVVTGDNDRVARKVCEDLGIPVLGTLTGNEVAQVEDDELGAAVARTTIFARVTPEQKARVIRAARRAGTTVGFLGDGVNDAVALHEADVGISVESASDVAKDAADIVLTTKDLDLLAEGVVQGRRIFANTIKYVLMATSSNFGNMFSAAAASLFLSFLPMLPTQILLNNFLYDVGELTIPTDNVDAEMLERPSQWDIALIRRFMSLFGPISSAFDFITFGVMLWVFHAGPSLFRSGWFVESLATQALVVFVIRTRRVPFYRSRPSRPLLATTLAVVLVGAALPYSPLAHVLGFTALPWDFFLILATMVLIYLVLVEAGKAWFFRASRQATVRTPRRQHERRLARRRARWSAWLTS
jgi:P-type Mg2+ transporter